MNLAEIVASDAYRRGRDAASATTARLSADVDLAAVGPCPNCGTPTRRLGGTPIAGSGLVLTFADRAWCAACLQAACVAAADEVRSRQASGTAAGDAGGDIGIAGSLTVGPYSARFPSGAAIPTSQ